MTIVVSEETGAVSLAVEGTLYRNIDANFLKSKLRFASKTFEGHRTVSDKTEKEAETCCAN